MVRSNTDWQFYIISGVVTFLILSAGILFGVFIGKEKSISLESDINDLRIRQDDTTLGFTLLSMFGNKTCDILGNELSNTMVEASKLSNEITRYEGQEKFKDVNYYTLKKDYTIIQVKYWFYLKKLMEDCNRKDFITVLYFYSNSNCGDCSKQATILTYLKDKYPNNIMNFALDYDIDLNTVRMLKSIYGVNSMPTLIINEKTYSGLVELDSDEANPLQ